MLIRFNPNKLQPPVKGAYFLDNVLLPPGVSTVDDAVTKHRAWQNLIDCEAIQVLKDDSKKELSLSEMTIAEARPLINEIQDKASLKQMKAKEKRKTLIEVIDDRIEELEEAS